MQPFDKVTFKHSEIIHADEIDRPSEFVSIIPYRVSKYRNEVASGVQRAKTLLVKSLGEDADLIATGLANTESASRFALCYPECPPRAAATLGEFMQVTLYINDMFNAMDMDKKYHFTQEALLALLFEFCQCTLGDIKYPATKFMVQYYRKVTRFATAEVVRSILGGMAEIQMTETPLVKDITFEEYKDSRASDFAATSGIPLLCHLMDIRPPQDEIGQVNIFLSRGYLSAALLHDLYTFNPRPCKDSTTKNALHILMRSYCYTEMEARDILKQEIEKSQMKMMDEYAAWKASDAPRSTHTEDYVVMTILYIGGSNRWVITSHPQQKTGSTWAEKEHISIVGQSSAAIRRLAMYPPPTGFEQSKISVHPSQNMTELASLLADQSRDTYETMRYLFDHPIPWKIRLRRLPAIRGVLEWTSKELQSLAVGLIRKESVPKHIAFVLDGNRRWAKSQGASVAFGHVKGVGTIFDASLISKAIASSPIENFKRPKAQVDFIIKLIAIVVGDLSKPNSILHQHRTLTRFMGRRDLLPPSIVTQIDNAIQTTQHYTEHEFNICVAYTGRDEITHAIRQTVEEFKTPAQLADEEVTADTLTRHMFTQDSPSLDLWVRTSGERRLSDFLLWQCHEESQIRFIKPAWPEFGLFQFYSLVRKWQKEQHNNNGTDIKESWLHRRLNGLKDRRRSVLTLYLRDEGIEKHLNKLSKVPAHLSVIMTLQSGSKYLATQVEVIAEMVMWAASAGIPTLSIYERTGVIKSSIHAIRRAIAKKSASYGGPPQVPSVCISSREHGRFFALPENATAGHSNVSSIDLKLLSASDGRDHIVELTKKLALAAQQGHLSPAEITLELVASKIADTFSYQESPKTSIEGDKKCDAVSYPPVKPDPDLLISFAQRLTLEGYPPWQLRLTEIFCTGDYGMKGQGVEFAYKAFIRSLYFFAGVEMRFGK